MSTRFSFVVTTPNYPCLRDGGQTLDGFNEYEAHQYNLRFVEFRSLGFTQIVGIGLKTPSFKMSRALASLGFHFPRFSRTWLDSGLRTGRNMFWMQNKRSPSKRIEVTVGCQAAMPE